MGIPADDAAFVESLRAMAGAPRPAAVGNPELIVKRARRRVARQRAVATSALGLALFASAGVVALVPSLGTQPVPVAEMQPVAMEAAIEAEPRVRNAGAGQEPVAAIEPEAAISPEAAVAPEDAVAPEAAAALPPEAGLYVPAPAATAADLTAAAGSAAARSRMAPLIVALTAGGAALCGAGTWFARQWARA